MNILLTAYKLEAGLGSEDASGYEALKHLVKLGHRVTLITRVNNAEKIRKESDFAQVRIIGLDVPKWLAFYKKGGRGIILYYYLWQIAVGLRVRSLYKKNKFDILHNYNFHTDWAPHFFPKKAAIVWGPVMHHQSIPFSFFDGTSLGDYFKDRARTFFKNIFWHLDPFLKLAVRKSNAIVYANKNLAPPFRQVSEKTHTVLMPGSSDEFLSAPSISDTFNVLFVGRFVALKGVLTCLQIYSAFLKHNPHLKTSMTLIGSGPLENRVHEEIVRLNLQDNVEIVSWIDRSELKSHYHAASLFLFPSFEAQGLVVSEAMSASLPTITISGTGPASVAGESSITVEYTNYASFIGDAANAVSLIAEEYFDRPTDYIDRANQSQNWFCERNRTAKLIGDIDNIYQHVLAESRKRS